MSEEKREIICPVCRSLLNVKFEEGKKEKESGVVVESEGAIVSVAERNEEENSDLAFASELQDLIEKYKEKDVPYPVLTGILETEKQAIIYDEKERFLEREEGSE